MSLASSYADALMDLAEQKECKEEIYEELQLLSRVIKENQDYLSIINNIGIPIEERKQLLEVLLEPFEDLIKQTVLVMCERNELYCFWESMESFISLYRKKHGIMEAAVISAIPLSEEKLEELKGILEHATKNTVMIENTVDEACVGGLNIRLNGYQYDETVATKISRIQSLLKTTSII